MPPATPPPPLTYLHGRWLLKVPALARRVPMRLRRSQDSVTTTGTLRDGTPVAVEHDALFGNVTRIYLGTACFTYAVERRRKIAGEYSDPCDEVAPVPAVLRKR